MKSARKLPTGTSIWAYQEKLKGRTTTGKVLGSNYGGWGFNNYALRRTPMPDGGGPRLAPVDMTPEEAIAAEPFFRPIGALMVLARQEIPD